jgi:tetratricopeptide (TPR) repeat protein
MILTRFVYAMCVGGGVLLTVACGSHGPPRSAPEPGAAPSDSLEVYIGKVRRLAAAAAPKKAEVATIESRDGELRTALNALHDGETPARHRRVAAAYRSAGVLDLAYDHYAAATRLDSRDAAAYDGLARIWRDWGLPHLGLSDARRAVFYAPGSPTVHNTLGTVLYALDQRPAARTEFERALALDPQASYALINLCYERFQASDFATAAGHCHNALRLDPASAPAHNNLALVYAATGQTQLAEAEFAVVGDAASRLFNAGIMYSAGDRYVDAAQAFDAAERLRPGWKLAGDRAEQARRLSQSSGPR